MSDLLADNPLARFSRGFFYPFRAGRYLVGHPRLWKFVLVPLLINIVVFSSLIYLGFLFFDAYVLQMVPSGEAWYWLILYYTLWALAAAVTGMLVFFTFTVVGNLVASPFNDLLSEKTEEMIVGTPAREHFSWAGFWADGKRILAMEARKMAVFVALMLLLLGLNFVPVVGSLLFSILAFLLTISFLAVEYLSFVAARKEFTYKKLRRYFFSRFSLLAGFGTGVFVLLAVPFLNFVSIPLGVIGATLVWFDYPPRPEDEPQSQQAKDFDLTSF
ncbi:MAG: sulfate transporter CysZ [Deltaproteobacteria bacterium]|nr:sulfate transporter CysZ [Deltaproteobacteria bacterium]